MIRRNIGAAVACGIAAVGVACDRSRGPDARIGELAVRGAVAPAPVYGTDADSAAMAVYLTIANRGSVADTLSRIESPSAGRAVVHEEMMGGAAIRMSMGAEIVPLPAGVTTAFAPGKRHIMLEGLTRRFAAGDTLVVTLVFARAGALLLRVPVVRYTDVLAVSGGSRAPARRQ